MELADLLTEIKAVQIRGRTDIEIKDVVYDSRQVQAASLFICIEGFKNDGHDFIDKAIAGGAAAIVIERELEYYKDDITYIQVDDSRAAMSFLAAAFYNYPLTKLDLIGVTGTNGKTTTTYLIKSILEGAGLKVGLIGTIKNIVGEKTLPATRTTPESLDLYQIFARMVKAGITHVVMEVSSHALDLKRVEGMEFLIAVFTNITQDHLDYHKSIEEYLQAKSQLFRQLKKEGFAVVNKDDPRSGEIIKASRGEVFTYSIKEKGSITADDIKLTPREVSFQVEGACRFHITLRITGLFNVYNALAAAACGHLLGISDQTIREGLESIQGVAGRFELVEAGQDFAVVVDYAHTPDGMENVLETARELVRGKLIIVFGCGGDRDRGKRPLMGQIAARYGDFSILTSDNPRSEEPLDIIAEIEAGINELDQPVSYQVEPDRREAIYAAIGRAGRDDMVVIFGKGHETYQIFKDKTIHFDDREVAREALRTQVGGE